MVSHRLILKITFRLKNNWSLTGLLAGAAGAAGLQHQRYWSAAVLVMARLPTAYQTILYSASSHYTVGGEWLGILGSFSKEKLMEECGIPK